MKINQNISGFFVVGVKDFAWNQELESFLKSYPVAGLAFFNSPYDSPTNIWKDPDLALEVIYDFLKHLESYPAFFAADQEGGRVRRMRGHYIHLPPAKIVSQAVAEKVWTLADVENLYRAAAEQMALSQINLNFAPVADLAYPNSHSVVGDRAYGSSADAVLPMVKIFQHAFAAAGVQTTLKHFPGHGPSEYDSHERIALLQKTAEEMRREDADIFRRALTDSSFAVMTAHLAFKEDPERIFSVDPELQKSFRAELQKHSRSLLYWITDDLLSMKAVSERKPWLAALDCAYDFILLCGTLGQSAVAIDESIRHLEGQKLDWEASENLEKRLLRSKTAVSKSPLLPWTQWKAKMIEIRDRAAPLLERLEIRGIK